MDTIIGIDLGTTNSLCAVFRDGQPTLIPNAHGDFLTPSVIGILEDGQIIVGAPARELRVTRPERCASTFKRLMVSQLHSGAKTPGEQVDQTLTEQSAEQWELGEWRMHS